MIVVAIRRDGGAVMVTVAPITRRIPPTDANAVELSVEAKRRLGLDDTGPSWVITHELNEFAWPGPDIRPVGSGAHKRFVYGLISRATFNAVRAAILRHAQAGALAIGRRR